MRGTPGQLKIAETTLNTPLVIDPEPQDPGALAHRILAHRGDFLLRKHTLDVFSNPKLIADAKAELKKSQGPNFTYKAMVGDRRPPLDYRKPSAGGS